MMYPLPCEGLIVDMRLLWGKMSYPARPQRPVRVQPGRLGSNYQTKSLCVAFRENDKSGVDEI